MPLFKMWDVSRTIKKAVVANSYEELVKKGKEKLGLDAGEECYVFEEADGTEVEDDECLLAYEKGTVFILGKQWKTETTEVGEVLDDTGVTAESNHVEEDTLPKMSEETLEVEKDTKKRSMPEEEETDCARKRSAYSGLRETRNEKTRPNKDICDVPNKDRSPIPSSSHQNNVKSYLNFLIDTPYKHAKMKNLKIYSEQEIASATSELERKRRRFWNDKAEQLATKTKTSKLDKTTIAGIIDVAWTLRKTSFIEGDARKIQNDEKVVFRKDNATSTKLGSQKKETIPKNLDRMAAAHAAVENLDKEIAECQQNFDKAKSKQERQSLTRLYNTKKSILDSAYTELKRAQEAMVKSIKAKRKQLEDRLKSTNQDSAGEPSTSTDGASEI